MCGFSKWVIKMNESKRNLLKLLGMAGVTGPSIPEKWSRPIVESVILPVHAQTSSDDDPVGNTPPIGADVTLDAGLTSGVSHDLDANISDNESPNSLLSIVNVSTPSEGSVVFTSSTAFTYTSLGNAIGGTASFTYQVQDPQGAMSAVYTVTIIDLATA